MTLAHDRSGSGEPLLLVHGFGSFRGVWRPVLPMLEREREVIAIDVPGFGDSPVDVEDPTPERLAERIARFLDELGLERPHVAGFSMGGWIALELNKMGRALTTCALCPAGFWNRWERAYCRRSLHNTRLSVKLMGGRAERLFQSATVRRQANRQYLEHGERMTPEEAVETVTKFAGAPGFDATAEALHDGHFTGGADVRQPATLAWGDKDKLLLPRQAERARRAIPQARHLWLPGCGHIPMVDDPDTTARAILTS
ncbi:MAG: alpha/beta fold hydrolase [Actinomycetota bacterium]|nr:alpha/beta fold hydrolase [Actinomycetota bacterium]MDQ5808295.1 alpha/beta fold hydrolase [Actinomycetota bacterium]